MSNSDLFPLLSFPNDIIWLMMSTYFEPLDALHCLCVCKRLYKIYDQYLIIRRVLVLVQRSHDDFHRQLNECIICPKCKVQLQSIQSLQKHLRKHTQAENRGKELRVYEPLQISQCYSCEMPTSNFTRHFCLLRQRNCHNGDIGWFYPWTESLCERHDWYEIDPNFIAHICRAKCAMCDEIFQSAYLNDKDDDDFFDGFGKHFRECPLRTEMIKKFNLRENNDEE